MRHKAGRYQRVVAEWVVHEVRPFAQAFTGATGPGCREIDNRRAHNRSHVKINGSLSHDFREIILIAETGRAAREHFCNCELRAVSYHLGTEASFFSGPDALV